MTKLLIGMPTYSGLVPELTTLSLFALQRPCTMGLMMGRRWRTDRARNIITQEVLNSGYDYLLFIDDDNPVPKETAVYLMEDDKDIVAAPILNRRLNKEGGKHNLCAFYGEYYGNTRFYFPIEKFKDEGYLHKVDACGLGCTMIKRKVLETLHDKYGWYIFEFGSTKIDPPIQVGNDLLGRRTMSEDVEFCERAADAGFEIWLDTRIRPIHLGEESRLQWGPPNINTADYWDTAWEREGEDTWRQYPLTFQKIAGYVSLEDTVLDIGCGVGVLLDVLKPLCKDVTGLDISPKAIKILESKGIHGKVGTLPKIDFPDKSFDILIATETLEHLDDPKSLLEEMKRVAQKKVIISVPDNVLGPEEEREHKQLFNRDSFQELLSYYFETVQIETFMDKFKTPTGNIGLPTLLAVCDLGEAQYV